MRPPGHVDETQDTEDTVGAAHRSAARAWGARPVPFRTRKLSPIAPRVLRGQPVGGQGAADRWTAPSRTPESKKGEASRPPPFLRNGELCSNGALSLFDRAPLLFKAVVQNNIASCIHEHMPPVDWGIRPVRLHQTARSPRSYGLSGNYGHL